MRERWHFTLYFSSSELRRSAHSSSAPAKRKTMFLFGESMCLNKYDFALGIKERDITASKWTGPIGRLMSGAAIHTLLNSARSSFDNNSFVFMLHKNRPPGGSMPLNLQNRHFTAYKIEISQCPTHTFVNGSLRIAEKSSHGFLNLKLNCRSRPTSN
jgi:hypothetical protein